jgi:hypothetical protein
MIVPNSVPKSGSQRITGNTRDFEGGNPGA